MKGRQFKELERSFRKDGSRAKRSLWLFLFIGLVVSFILWYISRDIVAGLVLAGAVFAYFLVRSAAIR